MERSVNVTVVYYSSTGTIHRLATEIMETAEKHGAEVRLVRAAELAPAVAIESRPAWKAHLLDTADVPIAAVDDVLWADAVVFGTPTRFGNVSAQLKQFIDTLGPAWFSGLLANKVYSAFTSGGSTARRHGDHPRVDLQHGLSLRRDHRAAGRRPQSLRHVTRAGCGQQAGRDVALRSAQMQAERVVRVARASEGGLTAVRVKDVFVNGNGVRLPSTLNVADAIESGECDPKLVARTDVLSVAVSPHESAAEMTVDAARIALAPRGIRGPTTST